MTAGLPGSPAIERLDLFSIPVWRSPVPEFDPYAEAMRGWVLGEWERGAFAKHAHGYGYQSPATLFSRQSLARNPGLGILKKAFADRAFAALRQRTNHFVHLPPEAYAFMAWVLVQTNESWVNNAWHDHAPALISGCYYLQIPECDDPLEGALAFMRPSLADGFTRQIQVVEPRQGEFVLFPSALTHRPQPTPTATGLRISVNMDCYVRWAHWDEETGPADPQAYKRRLEQTLDPDAEPPPSVGD
ncbi:MAG: putative 2OG-Fe(II) oxygenase [Wenzhouxiangellaceae bacterium]|nr:putative 2OG-Fe(II) oxygenase [Wenzhouxiangellaceae bacterium]